MAFIKFHNDIIESFLASQFIADEFFGNSGKIKKLHYYFSTIIIV